MPSRPGHPGVEAEPFYRAELVLVGNAFWAGRIGEAGGTIPGALASIPLVEYDREVRILEAYWKELFGESPGPAGVVLDDLPTAVAAAKAGGVASQPHGRGRSRRGRAAEGPSRGAEGGLSAADVVGDVELGAVEDPVEEVEGEMAQSVALDRLLPSWKERAFSDASWLETLLAEAAAAE